MERNVYDHYRRRHGPEDRDRPGLRRRRHVDHRRRHGSGRPHRHPGRPVQRRRDGLLLYQQQGRPERRLRCDVHCRQPQPDLRQADRQRRHHRRDDQQQQPEHLHHRRQQRFEHLPGRLRQRCRILREPHQGRDRNDHPWRDLRPLRQHGRQWRHAEGGLRQWPQQLCGPVDRLRRDRRSRRLQQHGHGPVRGRHAHQFRCLCRRAHDRQRQHLHQPSPA